MNQTKQDVVCNPLLASGLDAMRRTIREHEPARPSSRLSTMLAADLTAVAKHRRTEAAKLTSSIRGDLDWIVMKALEKDRTRRYDTAKVSMTGFGVPIATVSWMRTLVIGEDNDEKLMKLNEFALVVVVAKVPRLAAPEKSAMLYRSVAKIPAPEITTHTKVLEGCIADLTGSSNLARL